MALSARLEKDGRLDWVAEEMAVLADPATYRTDPERCLGTARPRTNNRRFLGMLQALAAWREREAQRINIPRQRLLKDETLLEFAATAPDTAAELARARGISEASPKGRSGACAARRDQGGQGAARRRHAGRAEATAAARAFPGAGVAAEGAAGDEVRGAYVAPSSSPPRTTSTGWRPRTHPDSGAAWLAARGLRRSALALKQGRIALGVAGRRVRLIPAH